MRRTWATHLMDQRSDGSWMCINCYFLAADAVVTGQLPPPGAPQPPTCSAPGFTGMLPLQPMPLTPGATVPVGQLPPSPQTWQGHYIAQDSTGAFWTCLDCGHVFADQVVSGARPPVGTIPVCPASVSTAASFAPLLPSHGFSYWSAATVAEAPAEAESKREGLCEECGRELCEYLDAYYGPERWKAGYCASCRPADKDTPSVADDYD